MSHDHGVHPGQAHAPGAFGWAFALGIALNSAYVLAQIVFGIAAHSLALLADAGHNLGDVLGLVLAWGASYLVTKRPSAHYTYGLRKTSILAALANAVFLLVAVGGITWEAVRRFSHQEPVAGRTVIWIAALGVVLNTGTALLFLSGRKGDLNIRGTFLHMASDAAVSLGVVIAGLAIVATGWSWLDPVVTLAINAVIVAGAWSLLRDSFQLSIDGVPPGIAFEAVLRYLSELPGVTGVHDLHIWAMSTTESALTAHLVMPGTTANDTFLHQIAEELDEKFGIGHPTLQIERGSPCIPECEAPNRC
jgi:cobalt-zinc-cadmium efflux system protein